MWYVGDIKVNGKDAGSKQNQQKLSDHEQSGNVPSPSKVWKTRPQSQWTHVGTISATESDARVPVYYLTTGTTARIRLYL